MRIMVDVCKGLPLRVFLDRPNLYSKTIEAHDESHRTGLFLEAFGGVLQYCSGTKELGYEIM